MWHLVAAAQTVSPDSPTAAVIAEAGGDPGAAASVNVQVSAGADRLAFDALRVAGVTLDGFVRAAAPRAMALGMTVRSDLSVMGWNVVRFATPAAFAGPPRVLFYTSRADVIYIIGDWSEEQLAVLLAALR